MGKLKELLKEKIGENEILNHEAMNTILSQAESVFTSANESNIMYDENERSLKVRQYVDGIEKETLNIKVNPNFIIMYDGLSGKEIRLDGEELELNEKIFYERTKGVEIIRNHKFMKNGLEKSLVETVKNSIGLGETQVTKRISRTNNGYLAGVFACDVDLNDPNLPVITDYEGTVNLDMRTPEIYFFGVDELGCMTHANNYVGLIPHKIDVLPDDNSLSDDAKAYVFAGINDMSVEEADRWKTIYNTPFKVEEKEINNSKTM